MTACYNAGLAKEATLAGRVAVTFVITDDGSVGSSIVQENALAGEVGREVASCIAEAAKDWIFPRPTGGGDNFIVTYPFRLTT